MVASESELGSRFLGKALARVLNLFPLTSIPAGLWMMAKWTSSNNTSKGNSKDLLVVISRGMSKEICSPPEMSVAVLAILPSTLMYPFFNAFFSADFVGKASKMPTPYSCSRWRFGICGTVWVSIFKMK